MKEARNGAWGTSLVVQWLGLRAPNAGVLGSIPGQGTGTHMPQLKTPHATTKRFLMLQLKKEKKDPACRKEEPTRGTEDPVCHK